MIESIKCIKNLGPFKSIENVPLAKTTLIFAENGRGKTMLSEAFRSLAKNEPGLVAGRARIGKDGGEPLIVLGQSGGDKVLRWERDGWKGGKPKMAVFNDAFVDANVCSGLEVSPSHLQGLHSVAVGEEGIQKARAYTEAGANVTATRKAKEEIEKSIRDQIGSEFKVDDFVRWEHCSDIDDLFAKNQEALKVAANAARIRQRDRLKPLPMPKIDFDRIQNTLSSSIDDMTTKVSEMVAAHLATLWDGAESWLNEGWTRARADQPCPYCGQDLANSQLVDVFKHYFDATYQDAKKDVASMLQDFVSKNDESSRDKLLATASVNSQLLVEWKSDGLKASQPTRLDAEAVVGTWQELSDGIVRALNAKIDAPLEAVAFDQRAQEAMDRFRSSVSSIKAENNKIVAVNTEIKGLVSQLKGADIDGLEREARRLRCLKLRGEPAIDKSCTEFKAARFALKDAEATRNARRKEMSEHNESAFRRYGAAINHHLGRFNVGFRIDELKGVSPGGVVTTQFGIVINNEDVKLNSPNQSASFSNTLSGGDRTALALAFFFASLDQRRDLCETVVVIDDPLSSLDAGRRDRTVSAIGRYACKVNQLIALSHDKSFLCEFRQKLRNTAQVTGLSVRYGGKVSNVGEWDLAEECRRDEEARGIRMRRFINGEEPATPLLYRDIRYHIENYLTIAFPGEFIAGSSIGDFLNIHHCEDQSYGATPLGSIERVEDLRELHEYSSARSHWNNVPDSQENELRSYVRQTLNFCRGHTADPTSEPD